MTLTEARALMAQHLTTTRNRLGERGAQPASPKHRKDLLSAVQFLVPGATDPSLIDRLIARLTERRVSKQEPVTLAEVSAAIALLFGSAGPAVIEALRQPEPVESAA